MGDIFISYSRKNIALATALAGAMTDLGARVLIDVAALEPGTDWQQSLSDNIDGSDVTIVLWSQASVQSEIVLWEANRAAATGKLFPIMTEDCRLPGDLSHLHCYNLKNLILDKSIVTDLLSEIIKFRVKLHGTAGRGPREALLPDDSSAQIDFEGVPQLGGGIKRCQHSITLSDGGSVVKLWTGYKPFLFWKTIDFYEGQSLSVNGSVFARLRSRKGSAEIDIAIEDARDRYAWASVSFFDPHFKMIFWKRGAYPPPDPGVTAS
jgi:hypothetical protein